MINTIKILCQDISIELLSHEEFSYLQSLKTINLSIEKLWQLMDQAWDDYLIDYEDISSESLSRFYSSPVWLLNGIFTECDKTSQQHRISMAQWIKQKNPESVADFGGGYGSLARKIANFCPNTVVKIVEPYPHKVSLTLANRFSNLEYVSELQDLVDIMVAQDVLEHVPDPLHLFAHLLDSTKVDGYLLIANCFYPVIKCHLPQTFHFRYSFKYIAPLLGCKYIGVIDGSEHTEIYRKNDRKPDWNKVKQYEKISRLLFPFLDQIKKILHHIRMNNKTELQEY